MKFACSRGCAGTRTNITRLQTVAPVWAAGVAVSSTRREATSSLLKKLIWLSKVARGIFQQAARSMGNIQWFET
jgi:hypothetical protein